MKYWILILSMLGCYELSAQATFIRQVNSIDGEFRYGVNALFERSDSTLLGIFNYKHSGSRISPAYGVFRQIDGQAMAESKLNTGIAHFNYQFKDAVLTSDDGLFLMADADGDYPHAIKFDKQFSEEWRVFSDNRLTTNPVYPVPFKALEFQNKIVAIGVDSNSFNERLMVYKLANGDSVLEKEISDYCQSCSDSVSSFSFSASNSNVYVQAIDDIIQPAADWKTKSFKLNAALDSAQVEDLTNHTQQLSHRVYRMTQGESLLILNDSVNSNSNYLLGRSLTGPTGSSSDQQLPNGDNNGFVYSVYDRFEDAAGNTYLHLLLDGQYAGVRFQRLLFQFSPNGTWLKTLEFYPFYENEYHDLYTVNSVIATKDGGFAFFIRMNVSAADPPQYLVKTDANLEVDGKPFFHQFVPSSVSNNYEQQGVQVFPNPANQEINLRVEEEGLQQLSLLNLEGQEVFSDQFEQSYRMDLSDMPGGVYLLRISNSDHFWLKRVVIAH